VACSILHRVREKKILVKKTEQRADESVIIGREAETDGSQTLNGDGAHVRVK
jgi:hypothetical protein